ncbi:MAG: class I SAM-dependent methyltransferase [Planctomycetaceae bacterium]|nr:class I SAM-dependent methyltransferase [Planctomycetaceae bacterium]
MSTERTAKTKAFGIEEGFPTYRLRQARYYELGMDIAGWAREHAQTYGRKLDLLDIGTWDGVTRKYIEAHPGHEHVRYHSVDIYPHGTNFVYKSHDWTFHNINLEGGLVGLASEAYDVVVCEQVLEHLHDVSLAIQDMFRVVRPGGRLILGVPTFPEGLHLIRKHVVPVTDRLFQVKKKRGHVQAWSKRTFIKTLRQNCPKMVIEKARGFRIISGGLLRPLEYQRWWWQVNRAVGRVVPSLCVEVQVIAHKPAKSVQPVQRRAA